MNFGKAIEALKQGKKVTRKGWNGKKMFLWLKPATQLKSDFLRDPILKQTVEDNGGTMDALGTICMKTADNRILTGWLASQTDMLSDDWEIIDGDTKPQCDAKQDKCSFESVNEVVENWQKEEESERGFIFLAVKKRDEDTVELNCNIIGNSTMLAEGLNEALTSKKCDLMKLLKMGVMLDIGKKLSKFNKD